MNEPNKLDFPRMRFRLPFGFAFSLVISICVPTVALSHDQIPGAPQQTPIALVGGTIHRVDASILDKGTVVFDQGKIIAVGKSPKLPKGCEVIDVSGKQVYPGLMESMSNMGLAEIGSVRATIDTNEVGDENPNLRPWVAVNPDSELIPVARAGGTLLTSIAPQRGNVRGQTAVLGLDGWTYQDMLVKTNTGLVISWRGYDSREDDDRKRAEQRSERLEELSDRFDEAIRYAESLRANPKTSSTDLRLEAMLPVVRGECPVIVIADSRREIEAAIAFCVEREFELILYGGYDAEQCAPLLKKFDIPVIIRSTYRLPRRRDDPYDHPYTLPKRLHDAGVRFAIGGPGAGSPNGASDARNLPYHAAVAVAYGLSEEKAIESITLAPAKIMGVDDRVGSITPGKDATLIVSDGDILLTESHVTMAFLSGAAIDLGSKHKTLAEKYRVKYSRGQ